MICLSLCLCVSIYKYILILCAFQMFVDTREGHLGLLKMELEMTAVIWVLGSRAVRGKSNKYRQLLSCLHFTPLICIFYVCVFVLL